MSRAPTMSDANKATVRKMREQGFTWHEIDERLGRARGSTLAAAHRNGWNDIGRDARLADVKDAPEITPTPTDRYRAAMSRIHRTMTDVDRETVLIATTDYVTRAPEGGYINAHLYRVPVTISKGHRS